MSPHSQNSIRSRKFPYAARQYATMCNCIIMLLIKKPRFYNLASFTIFSMRRCLYEKEATVKHQIIQFFLFLFLFLFFMFDLFSEFIISLLNQDRPLLSFNSFST